MNDDDMLKNAKEEKEQSNDSLLTTNKDRFFYLNGPIDEEKSKDTIEKLLELQATDPLEDITIVINSAGGEIYSMFAITDMIDIIHPSVRTVCLGTAMSASAFIFLCGTPGKRFMTKHSSLMLHQVSGGAGGTTKDIDVQVKEIKFLQGQMVEEIANRSNLSVEQIMSFINRDYYLRPEKAIEYGLCDGIIRRLS